MKIAAFEDNCVEMAQWLWKWCPNESIILDQGLKKMQDKKVGESTPVLPNGALRIYKLCPPGKSLVGKWEAARPQEGLVGSHTPDCIGAGEREF